jgi:hypothetical protein
MSNFNKRPQVPLNSTVLKIKDSLLSTGGKYVNAKPVDLTALSGVAISGVEDGQLLMYKNGQLVNIQMQGNTRPASPVIGQPFFDTNLGIPIWYTGANWVSSSGNII